MTPHLAATIIGGLIVIAIPLFIFLLASICDQGIDHLTYGPAKDDGKDTHPWTHW